MGFLFRKFFGLAIIFLLSALLAGCRSSNAENAGTSQMTPFATAPMEVQPSSTPAQIVPSASSPRNTPLSDLGLDSGADKPSGTRGQNTPIPSPTPRSSLTPEPSPTATPHPTSTPDPEVVCKPIPSDFFVQTDAGIYAICQRKMVLMTPPVKGMYYLDYTPLTGRVAYSNLATDQNDLWVYDYWSGTNKKWVDDQVESAFWAPIKNAKGVQPLAVLFRDGTLASVSGPGEILPLESGLEGSCFIYFPSVEVECKFYWAPDSERIAYLKDGSLYVVPADGGQPRKLAENAYAISWSPRGDMIAYVKEGALFLTPPDASRESEQITGFGLVHRRESYAWAPEAQAIIVPGAPLKIVKLDGSDRFTPTRFDGVIPSDLEATAILWSGESRLLVYSDSPYPCDPTGRAWVYELSGDLKRIHFYYYVTGENLSLSGWEIPGESVYGWGGFSSIAPSPQKFRIEGKILHYRPRERRMYLGNAWENARTILLRDDMKIIAADGQKLTIYGFKPWLEMPVEVVCQPILEESSETCMATEIRILDK